VLLVVVAAGVALAQETRSPLEPVFSIWDVTIGGPVAELPDKDVNDISCGTNGGPPSLRLESFADFATCPPEASGLREVYFIYDDELDYIARALENEYRVMQGGTSVFAHPVIVSVLVDEGGIVRGIRIVTDDRASTDDRRTAASLGRNFKARFGPYNLVCEDLPPEDGQQPLGRQFLHEICEGTSPEGDLRVRFESTYFRKRGQEALDRETQLPNADYFESTTRLDLVQVGY
jgi:hypothetical protein